MQKTHRFCSYDFVLNKHRDHQNLSNQETMSKKECSEGGVVKGSTNCGKGVSRMRSIFTTQIGGSLPEAVVAVAL
ncbi:MAG: hypothetical protein P8J87_11480, partial [Verrucomicrobiales bacterium]|nr:hypothetical protein [Verrucomicrobiales bacterium]